MNKAVYKIIKLFFPLAIFLHQVQAQTVIGYVFEDINKNGTKENNEPGIKGVAVSDQVNVVLTNDEGMYKIDSKGYGIIFISMPNGYSSKTFWKNTTSTSIDFSLVRSPSPSSFQFIHASDTHISEKSVDRMDKFRAIVDSVHPEIVLITGDLVKDALRVDEKEATGYYELFIKECNRIKYPVWLVPGNHEIFGPRTAAASSICAPARAASRSSPPSALPAPRSTRSSCRAVHWRSRAATWRSIGSPTA